MLKFLLTLTRRQTNGQTNHSTPLHLHLHRVNIMKQCSIFTIQSILTDFQASGSVDFTLNLHQALAFPLPSHLRLNTCGDSMPSCCLITDTDSFSDQCTNINPLSFVRKIIMQGNKRQTTYIVLVVQTSELSQRHHKNYLLLNSFLTQQD